MPAGDEFLSLNTDVRRAAAMMGLLGASANVYDAFSAVMSSPWSTEKFTNSPEEERMAREYVAHALIISGGYALMGAWIGRSAWPIIGAVGVAAYMYWLYARALTRATAPGGMRAPAGGTQPQQVAGDSAAWTGGLS
jgi:hypothetical protein